jgi:hypothetical protein
MRSSRQRAVSRLCQGLVHLVLLKTQRPGFQRDQGNPSHNRHQITRRHRRVTRMRLRTICLLWMLQDLNTYLHLQVMITCYDRMRRRVGLTLEKFDRRNGCNEPP